MTLPLVVGVDGSDGCLAAVDWAVDEAARRDLPLRLVHGSLWEHYAGTAPPAGRQPFSERMLAEHVVTSAAERAARRGPAVRVGTDIVPADPVDALLHAGDNAFALVTGERGRGELKGMLLGSVSVAVAGRAHCPVIVVRGEETGLAGVHERVLFGAGDAATAGQAVRFAFEEATVRGCAVEAVRAWRCPVHEDAGRSALVGAAQECEARAAAELDELLAGAVAAHPDVPVRRVTVGGPAHHVLVEQSAAADLVVLGARRRHGRFGLQLGRVGHTLLHHAACPVAVVPQLA